MSEVKGSKKKGYHATLIIFISLFVASTIGTFFIGYKDINDTKHNSKHQLEELDNQIAALKRKAAAKKKADQEAAQQRADSDAALEKQLRGETVTPKGCAVTGAHGNPNSIDVVINKKRCFNPIDFEPADLSYYNGFALSAKAIPDLVAMFSAAANTGYPLSITSAYRSYTNQVETYNHWVGVNGSIAAADTVSARPGYSEHQTGYVVDLSASGCSLECFGQSMQYAWLQENAAEYGFIERYPRGYEAVTGYSPESWHWRYIGKQAALDMKSKGIKTLEQYWKIPGGTY